MCKSGTNTVTNNSQPPQWLQNELQNLGTAGQNIVQNNPTQQYSGSLVAGFTPDQQAAMSTVDNAQGIAQPFINSGAQFLGQAGSMNLQGAEQPYIDAATNSLSPSSISQFESPYTQQVVNATQAQFNNQNAQQQQGVVSNAINAGAFGGDRASVAQGITAGQQQLAEAPQIANLENTGYQTALQTAQANAGIQQQAANSVLGANEAQGWLGSSVGNSIAGLGTAAQNSALTGASAQLQSGALQQQLGQEQLNIPYEQFQQQQASPYQQLGWLAGIEEGTGGSAGGTSSTSSPGPSTASAVGGAGLAGISAIGGTGGFGSSGWLSSLFSKRGGRIPHRASGGILNGIMGGQLPGILNTGVPGGGLISDTSGLGSFLNLTGGELPGITTNSITMNELPEGISLALRRGGAVGHYADGGFGGVALPIVPVIGPTSAYATGTNVGIKGGSGIPKAPAPYKPESPLAMASAVGSAFKNAGINNRNPSSTQTINILPANTDLTNTGQSAQLLGSLAPDFGSDAPSSGYSRGGIIPLRRASGGSSPSPTAAQVALINQDYQTYLGRGPQDGDVAFYANALNNGLTPQDMANDFTNSPEYKSKFGNKNVTTSATQSGVIIPQVTQGVWNNQAPNIAAMSGGPAGLGTAFNPLPQYQPPGTTTSGGGITFPHYTVPAVTGMFGGPAAPKSHRGGIIPFVKRRDDGGALPDDSTPPSNWRASSLDGVTPNYQTMSPSDLAAVKQNITSPHVDPWNALAQAGFAMMAGTSPHALTNIGRGAMTGLEAYNSDKQQASANAKTGFDVDQKAMDLANNIESRRLQDASAKESAAEVVARDAQTAAQQRVTNAETAARDAQTANYQQGQLKIQQQNANTNAAPSYDFQPGFQVDPATGNRTEGAWKTGDDGSNQFIPGMVVAKPGAAAASPVLPVSGNTFGEKLDSLPPTVAPYVKSMIEGRTPPPSGTALKDPTVRSLIEVAHEIDPSFDEGSWTTKYKTRQSFSGNGIDAQTTGAGVQLMNHLDDLDKTLKNVGNYNLGPASGLVNGAINYVTSSSNPAINDAGLATQAVATEAGKLWRGTGAMSEKEIGDWASRIPINAAPRVQEDVAPKIITLADGRFDALRNKWQSAMGPNIPMPPLFTQSTQEKYDRLSKGQGRYVSSDIPRDSAGNVDPTQALPGKVYKTPKAGYVQWDGHTFIPLNN